ncbi:MAG: hypothetical protein QXG12_05950 [Thermoproteota archaeon]
MPMIYVSEKTYKLLEELINMLRKDVKSSVRLIKSDIIHEALKEYARKLGVHIDEDTA